MDSFLKYPTVCKIGHFALFFNEQMKKKMIFILNVLLVINPV